MLCCRAWKGKCRTFLKKSHLCVDILLCEEHVFTLNGFLPSAQTSCVSVSDYIPVMKIRIKPLIQMNVASGFLLPRLSLNHNGGNTSKLIPTGTCSRPTDEERRYSPAPCRSGLFPSSGAVGWGWGSVLFTSVAFCIIVLFGYLHAAVFSTLFNTCFWGTSIFNHSSRWLQCGMLSLKHTRPPFLFLAGGT